MSIPLIYIHTNKNYSLQFSTTAKCKWAFDAVLKPVKCGSIEAFFNPTAYAAPQARSD